MERAGGSPGAGNKKKGQRRAKEGILERQCEDKNKGGVSGGREGSSLGPDGPSL